MDNLSGLSKQPPNTLNTQELSEEELEDLELQLHEEIATINTHLEYAEVRGQNDKEWEARAKSAKRYRISSLKRVQLEKERRLRERKRSNAAIYSSTKEFRKVFMIVCQESLPAEVFEKLAAKATKILEAKSN
jgi:hypothetical protein